MDFIDRARIKLEAGKGGNGCVAFRREKYVEFGGPNGGDGGDGGSIYVKGTQNMQTLAKFKDRYLYRAQKGGNGEGKDRYGKKGEDLILEVPLGTVIYDEFSGNVVADIVSQEVICLAIGGYGGKGNTHFKSSTNKAPQYAEPGSIGQTKQLILELKIIADVGLVGFPNAGKSTLITAVSNSHSQVAAYAFSTLRPYLGVVKLSDWQHFIMADIPGIIENAHQGKGVGIKFLKHIERSKVHLFVIDLFSEDLVEVFHILKKELSSYNESLSDFPYLVALNKIDGFPKQDWQSIKDDFVKRSLVSPKKVFMISAIKKIGLEPLMKQLFELVQKEEYHSPTQREGINLEESLESPVPKKLEPLTQKTDSYEDEIEIFWETGKGQFVKENSRSSSKRRPKKSL
jgi:GTP-binding protein